MEKYDYEGYTFDTREEMQEARREKEAVDYLRAHADMNNAVQITKLYNKLLDQKTLTTQLGVAYLKELREQIVKSNSEADNSLRPVPAYKRNMTVRTERAVKDATVKAQKEIVSYKKRCKGLIIACIIMGGMIIAMFAITLTGYYSPFRDYETELKNQYGGWSDSLTLKEKQLKEKEQELGALERKLTQREEELQAYEALLREEAEKLLHPEE